MIRATLAMLLLWTIPALGEDGRFVDAGKMTTTRVGHSATLLKDGRVLLAGGSDGVNILTSTELFDPSRGDFSPTGSMLAPRIWHSAALLPDGKVLIVGGGGGKVTDPEGEIYDPGTGTFSPYPPEAIIRLGYVLMDATTGTVLRGHSENPIRLKDGRFVVAKHDQVEVYRIENNTLQLMDAYPLSTSWYRRGSVQLADGTILIAGGDATYDEDSTPEAYIFDPGKGTLRRTGSLSQSRGYGHQMTLLPDGTVLVSGGSPAGYAGTWPGEIYEPISGRFSAVQSLDAKQTATMLLDGRVLLAGGAGPLFYYPRDFVLSATGLSEHVAPGSLGTVFGGLLSSVTKAADPRSPGTSLAGVEVDLIDRSGATRPARLLYVSPTQINFEVPEESLPGDVRYIVRSLGQKDREIKSTLENVAPSLFALAEGRAAAYAIRFDPDGHQTVTLATEPILIDERPVYLVLYATGLRGSDVGGVICEVDGVNLPVEYAGPAGDGIPGLDQVNVRLPASLRERGVVTVMLTVDGVQSNVASIEVR